MKENSGKSKEVVVGQVKVGSKKPSSKRSKGEKCLVTEVSERGFNSLMEVVEGVPVARPGRRMGSGNNVSVNLRAKMSAWLEDHFEDFNAAFAKMTPRDQVDAYLTMYKYSVPETKHEDDRELNSSARRFVIETYFGGKGEG
ncbi:hypothetical protein [uncultured Porphyromonas sp.]|uniref:hypothetical protein n=1 Tax=uncultured Porphyromonas sp. TaxID=159274 RepID=UPI0026000A07|nr:hypothetical protein [uncultured Porphyromonas sp.]